MFLCTQYDAYVILVEVRLNWSDSLYHCGLANLGQLTVPTEG